MFCAFLWIGNTQTPKTLFQHPYIRSGSISDASQTSAGLFNFSVTYSNPIGIIERSPVGLAIQSGLYSHSDSLTNYVISFTSNTQSQIGCQIQATTSSNSSQYFTILYFVVDYDYWLQSQIWIVKGGISLTGNSIANQTTTLNALTGSTIAPIAFTGQLFLNQLQFTYDYLTGSMGISTGFTADQSTGTISFWASPTGSTSFSVVQATFVFYQSSNFLFKWTNVQYAVFSPAGVPPIAYSNTAPNYFVNSMIYGLKQWSFDLLSSIDGIQFDSAISQSGTTMDVIISISTSIVATVNTLNFNFIGFNLQMCDSTNSYLYGTSCFSGGCPSTATYLLIEKPTYFSDRYTCFPCIIGCLNCLDGISCSNCDASLYRQLQTVGNTCVCMQKYFQNNGAALCDLCHYSCLTCEIISTNCTSCQPNDFRSLVGNACPCNPKYYDDTINSLCLPCHHSCQQCLGIGTNCTLCNSVSLRVISVSTCPCLVRSYDDGINQLCVTCNYTCYKCLNSQVTCTACSAGDQRTLSFGLCLCKNGFFEDGSSTICPSCHYSCKTCSKAFDNCTACNATLGRSISTSGTSCICSTIGQFDDGTNTQCGTCDITCVTCEIIQTNCTSCDSTNLKILVGNSCVCPDRYYSDTVLTCAPCNYTCLTCTTIPDCATCQPTDNRQMWTDGITCGCMDGFYEDGISTICPACQPRCLTCDTNQTNCLTCDPNQFRTISGNVCLCNDGYYQLPAPGNETCDPCGVTCLTCQGTDLTCLTCDSTMKRTLNSTTNTCDCNLRFYHNGVVLCASCDSNACKGCQSTSLNCTSCNPGQFLQFSYSFGLCLDVCPPGSYGLVDKCVPCGAGCKVCTNTADNCSSCQAVGSTNYYYNPLSNTCGLNCSSGFQNSVTFACQPCNLFTYQGNCLTECPASTRANVSIDSVTGATISICIQCHDNCASSADYLWRISSTKVGDQIMNKVSFPKGLHNSITTSNFEGKSKVKIVKNTGRRLLEQETLENDSNNRLLATIEQYLTVKSIKIDDTRLGMYIITTSLDSFAFSQDYIVIQLPTAALIAADGTLYGAASKQFSLNNPQFISSVMSYYTDKVYYYIPGIIFCMLAFFLYILSLVNRKTHHQIVIFAMFLQIIGIMRIKKYPLDFSTYSVLYGFSMMELPFLPNGFYTLIYPDFYFQTGVNSVIFTSSHNFVQNVGSLVQVIIVLQIALFIYYLIKKNDKKHVKIFKFFQQAIFMFFWVKIVFSVILSFIGMDYNPTLFNDKYFIASQALGFLFFGIIVIYTLVNFKDQINRSYELYKIQAAFRIIFICLLNLSFWSFFAIFLIFEIIFLVLEMWLYRKKKTNLPLYIIEWILTEAVLASAIILQNSTILIFLLCFSILPIFMFKIFYIYLGIKRFKQGQKIHAKDKQEVIDQNSLNALSQNKIFEEKSNRSQKQNKIQSIVKKYKKTQVIDQNLKAQQKQYSSNSLADILKQQENLDEAQENGKYVNDIKKISRHIDQSNDQQKQKNRIQNNILKPKEIQEKLKINKKQEISNKMYKTQRQQNQFKIKSLNHNQQIKENNENKNLNEDKKKQIENKLSQSQNISNQDQDQDEQIQNVLKMPLNRNLIKQGLQKNISEQQNLKLDVKGSNQNKLKAEMLKSESNKKDIVIQELQEKVKRNEKPKGFVFKMDSDDDD